MTDIPFEDYPSTLADMLRGNHEEDPRLLMQASVWRDGVCV